MDLVRTVLFCQIRIWISKSVSTNVKKENKNFRNFIILSKKMTILTPSTLMKKENNDADSQRSSQALISS